MQTKMHNEGHFCEKKTQKTQKQAKKPPFVVEKSVETVDNYMHRGCGKLGKASPTPPKCTCAKPQNCLEMVDE